jgi:hypothetical protein
MEGVILREILPLEIKTLVQWDEQNAVKNRMTYYQSALHRWAYGLDGRGSIPGRGKKFFFFSAVQAGLGAHPAYYTMGVRG